MGRQAEDAGASESTEPYENSAKRIQSTEPAAHRSGFNQRFGCGVAESLTYASLDVKSKILKASGILISVSSALFGAYWIWVFAGSTGPDRAISIAPLFFCGLPLTVVGQIVSFGFQTAGRGVWYGALPIVVCYFFQWQFIGLWLYRKSYA